MFTEMLIVLLLILLNGVFAMAELALVSARRVRLKQMAEKGSRGASVAIALQEDPSGLLSTAQVGITLISILAGAYGSATLAERLTDMLRTSTDPVVVEHAHTIAMAAVVAGIGYVTLILGELVPKRLAMAAAERIASISARPMRLLSKVAAPVVWFLRGSTDLMLKMLRVRASDETISEEEVKSLIAEGTEQGVFHKQEREMIEGVLKMADRSIRAVMTPRPEVIWLEVSDDMETVRAKIRASGHSRFPVSRGDIEEIVGVVRTTDLMELMLSDKSFDV
ncbi:MAG: hemolysin family protein, partial [Rhodospirillales bacterium]|nr:hemolysin family protein [Rhodospirillales bacterium]